MLATGRDANKAMSATVFFMFRFHFKPSTQGLHFDQCVVAHRHHVDDLYNQINHPFETALSAVYLIDSNWN